MLRTILILLLLPVHTAFLSAQNLILNPSFEEYDNCPADISCVNKPSDVSPIYCINWTKPTTASTDYYNECAPLTSNAGIPVNLMGNQEARTGAAYMGMWSIIGSLSQPELYREYLQGRIAAPLKAGNPYFLNYWVNIGNEDPYMCSLDQLGAIVVKDLVEEGTTDVLTDYTISITSPEDYFYTNSEGWEPVNGDFIAEGDEAYVIIGSFTDKNDVQFSDCGGSNIQSYYFIEDVCLLDLESPPVRKRIYQYEKCEHEDTVFTHTLPANDSIYAIWSDGSHGSSKSYSETGRYWVKKVNIYHCTYSIDSILVVPKTNFELSLGKDTAICQGESIIIGQDIDVVHSYKWSTGDTSPFITVSDPGMYTLEAISDCNTIIDSIFISFYDEVEVQLPGDTFICDGKEIEIVPWLNFTKGVSYVWSDQSTAPTLVLKDSAFYTLTVTDRCGTSSSDSMRVELVDCRNCVFMPNAFSPNADGLNDAFGPVAACLLLEYTLCIYNRFGQLVYISYNPRESWDGTFNGKQQDAGVFFYMLQGKPDYPNAREIIIKGDVTLIR